MGTVSTIERLPEDILDQLHALLRDKRVSQLETTARINALLEESGREERVSKSAMNRYDQKMKKAGERIMRAREVAKVWIDKLGAAPQGDMGNLITQMIQSIAFDLAEQISSSDLSEETAPEIISQLRHLSLIAVRMEKASSENVKREAELKKKAREEAAETAVKTAKSLGVTQETIDEIHRKVLGI